MNLSRSKNKYTPYKLIMPVFIFMLAVYGYPVILTFFYSFHEVSLIGEKYRFAGLSNYIGIMSDPDFYEVVLLTLAWTALSVFFKVTAGFFMALLLNSNIYFQRGLRFLMLIPWAIPQVVVAIVWSWILDGDLGYLNYALMSLAIAAEPVRWLSEGGLAFVAVSFVDAWIGIPLVTMIFLSGLSGISNSLYEAAKVDGAGIFKRFVHITLPNMRSIIMITLTLTTIWSFNSFNIIFVLTNGGPMGATNTMMIEIYKTAFGKYNLGMSSTLSVIAFSALTLLSILYWKQIEKDAI